MSVQYAYQEWSDLPDGYRMPEARVKPRDTAHALLAARSMIDGPFAESTRMTTMGQKPFRKSMIF